jgi:hypothetical protein
MDAVHLCGAGMPGTGPRHRGRAGRRAPRRRAEPAKVATARPRRPISGTPRRVKARNWSRFLLRLWVVGSTLWVCFVGFMSPDIFQSQSRWFGADQVARIEAGNRACEKRFLDAFDAASVGEDAAAKQEAVPGSIDWESILSDDQGAGRSVPIPTPDAFDLAYEHETVATESLCRYWYSKHAALKLRADNRRQALAVALAPPLVALVLGFAAQWIIQGL